MAANRVKSKNLFNFRPAGAVDAITEANEKEMMEKSGMDRAQMMETMKALSDEEFAGMLNGMMDGEMMDMMFKNTLFAEVWKEDLLCVSTINIFLLFRERTPVTNQPWLYQLHMMGTMLLKF